MSEAEDFDKKCRSLTDTSTEVSEAEDFDICIIGAGPGGLAALSAVVEPYSVDKLNFLQSSRAARANSIHQKQGVRVPRVCVVDEAPWLTTWRQRFHHLDIEWLRSPTIAHPDLFDSGAMQAFAGETKRTNELLESGCVDAKLRQLQEASDGSWHLPSNKLFLDFCDQLAKRLPHEFVTGQARSIRGVDGQFTVELEDGRQLRSGAVVLSIGVPGPPVVPACIANLPSHLMFHSDFEYGKRLKELEGRHGAKRILVLGGGLTAVQVALLGVKKKCKVILCSRRSLTTRHFDISKDWFDKRTASRHRFEFFSMPLEERLAMIKETRGGGSVPSFYMEQVRRAESSGRLELKVSELQVGKVLDHGVDVELDGSIEHFDLVVSACGHRPDCTLLPVVQSLLENSPSQITGGFPHVSEDLQWQGHKKLFVIGALASLQVGPDAGNLMGIRRAAQTMTATMGFRDWLHEFSQTEETSLQRNIRGNRFDILLGDDDDDDDDDEDAEPDDKSDECNKDETEPSPKVIQHSGKATKRRMGKRRGGHKSHRP